MSTREVFTTSDVPILNRIMNEKKGYDVILTLAKLTDFGIASGEAEEGQTPPFRFKEIDGELFVGAVEPSLPMTCLLYTSPSPRD